MAAAAAGRLDEAIDAFADAERRNPRDGEASFLLARAYLTRGARVDALCAGLRAIGRAPTLADGARLAASVLSDRKVTGLRLGRDELRGLRTALGIDDLNRQGLAGLAAEHAVKAGSLAAANRDPATAADWLIGPKGRAARADGLVQALLTAAINTDPTLERILVGFRRRLAETPLSDWPRDGRDLAVAMARQLHRNEYAWPTTAAEDAAADALDHRIADTDKPSPDAVLLLLLYRPLRRWRSDPKLSARAVPATPAFAAAIDEQAREIAGLAAATDRVEVLLPPHEDISHRVQAQYEENPYPRWSTLSAAEPGSWRQTLGRIGMRRTADAIRPPFDVLIAGCGTGRHALVSASRYGADASVLAVDLSLESLRYGAWKAATLGIGNVRFAQADLLRLPELGRRFQIIESVGVVHHLADPARGVAALADCLAPGGLLRLAVYSRRARWAVAEARRDIAARAIGTGDSDLRAYRRHLLDSDAPHDRALRESLRDIHSLSGLRDLLFHVQEHTFSVPGVAEMLAQAGLVLGAVDVAAPVRQRLVASAGPAALLDPHAWDAFEASHPDTFLGMIDVWCRCRDPA